MNIKHVGVIGAGQMGQGIAQVAAQIGCDVLLLDVSRERAQYGVQSISNTLARLVEKEKITSTRQQEILEHIKAEASLESFAGTDIVIEAATENESVKLDLMQKADAVMPPAAILASNTSSISITKLAAATKRAEHVVGMHFMNPVPVMKLVEVIRAVQSSDATFERTIKFAKALGKTVITSKDTPGFVVNRMLIPFLNEACFALQEGLSSPEEIDEGVRLGLNHPMGPLELADFVGLDTVLAIAEVLHRELGDDKYRPATVLRNYVAAGWLGRKSGRGFYSYTEK